MPCRKLQQKELRQENAEYMARCLTKWFDPERIDLVGRTGELFPRGSHPQRDGLLKQRRLGDMDNMETQMPECDMGKLAVASPAMSLLQCMCF